jgi:hypothetical protein
VAERESVLAYDENESFVPLREWAGTTHKKV